MARLDQALFAAYLAAVLVVGLRAGRKAEPASTAGYLLAGRALTLPGFVATLVASWYGGILGVGEYSFKHGLSNWIVFGVPYYLAAALFAAFLARRARETEASTLPEQLRRTYGPGAGAVAAGIVFLTSVPAAYVVEVGILMKLVFGIPFWAGLLFGCAFPLLYVWRAGFGSVAGADKMQFLLMFGGFLMLVPLLAFQHGGLAFIEANVPTQHLSWDGGRSAQSIAVWYLIALATLVEPAFYQRCFAAKSPAVARWGIALSILCWGLFDALTTTAGLYARALLTDLPASRAAEAFPLLALRYLPMGLCGLFFVSMAAAAMSTVDSYLFITASTFGRDLAGNSRRFRDRVPLATRVGLLVASVLSLGFGWLSQSVVNLWHGFGSVATATLLLPVVGAFVPRLRMSPRAALVHLVAVLVFTTAWLGSRLLPGRTEFFLGLEPIYAGLGMGALVWCIDRFAGIVGGASPAARPEVETSPGR